MTLSKLFPLVSILIFLGSAHSPNSLAETRIGEGYAPNGESVSIFVDRIPRLKYPRKAQRLGVEGYVDIACDIDSDGNKTDLRVLAAEPRRIFDKAALDFVEAMNISPPLLNGTPVDLTDANFRVNFRFD
jgi:TonB family protein